MGSNSKLTIYFIKQLINVLLNIILRSRKVNSSAHNNNERKSFLLQIFKHCRLCPDSIVVRIKVMNGDTTFCFYFQILLLKYLKFTFLFLRSRWWTHLPNLFLMYYLLHILYQSNFFVWCYYHYQFWINYVRSLNISSLLSPRNKTSSLIFHN